MTKPMMNLLQTYKAKILNKNWEKDLEILNKENKKIIYQKALSWKGLLKLSIAIDIFIVLVYGFLSFNDYGMGIMPLMLLIGVFVALQPTVMIVLPLVIYNIVRVTYNKIIKRDIIRQNKQRQEDLKINLQTIQNGLKYNTIVPSAYQSELALEKMMEDVQQGIADNDKHAVERYIKQVEMEDHNRKIKELKYKEQKQQQKRGFIQNAVMNLLFYSLIKDLFSSNKK